MPQMMPLNWISMLTSINILLLIFSIIIFNMFIPTMTNKNKYMLKLTSNKWAW